MWLKVVVLVVSLLYFAQSRLYGLVDNQTLMYFDETTGETTPLVRNVSASLGLYGEVVPNLWLFADNDRIGFLFRNANNTVNLYTALSCCSGTVNNPFGYQQPPATFTVDDNAVVVVDPFVVSKGVFIWTVSSGYSGTLFFYNFLSGSMQSVLSTTQWTSGYTFQPRFPTLMGKIGVFLYDMVANDYSANFYAIGSAYTGKKITDDKSNCNAAFYATFNDPVSGTFYAVGSSVVGGNFSIFAIGNTSATFNSPSPLVDIGVPSALYNVYSAYYLPSTSSVYIALGNMFESDAVVVNLSTLTIIDLQISAEGSLTSIASRN